jgi:MoxR-like ATPase
VRGAIDLALVADQLLRRRGTTELTEDAYRQVVFDAMSLALSGRIHLDETVEATPEDVLHQIWEDYFVLGPATAAPG